LGRLANTVETPVCQALIVIEKLISTAVNFQTENWMKDKDHVQVLRLKLWLERSDATPPATEWRGELKQLETGKVVYFRHFSGFSKGLSRLGIVEINIENETT